MMNHNSLVAANLSHHPGRTAASVAGVAVGVVLIVLTVGLVRGMLRDRGQRDTNTGVELMFCLRDQFGISVTSLPLTLPLELVAQVRAVPGVAAVTPVGQHLEFKGESGLGLRQLDGVEFRSYTQATEVRIVTGQPLPDSGDAVIVDTKYAAHHRTNPGDQIMLFDRPFTVAGIYAPETGARLMVPLTTMQEALGAPGKASMLLVKCQNPAGQDLVAQRLAAQFPQARLLFTRDLPRLFATGYDSFNLFLQVVAGLAIAISLLVTSLTMYTAVTERTRQIGILKALGASQRFIASVFFQESLLISLLGVVVGLVIALMVRYVLLHTSGTKLDIELDYVTYAALGSLLSGLGGALYPAWRAARQDVVDALSYE